MDKFKNIQQSPDLSDDELKAHHCLENVDYVPAIRRLLVSNVGQDCISRYGARLVDSRRAASPCV